VSTSCAFLLVSVLGAGQGRAGAADVNYSHPAQQRSQDSGGP
jgi:hypothetical protein